MRDSGEAGGEGGGTFLGPIGRSQTRVPGLALSRPYHCTSASSEHKGLLRKQLSLNDPLCQLRTCCGLQGGVGVGVAACSLEGVKLLWLRGDAAGEPLASVPTRLPRLCPRVPCCDPVSEEVDPECE